MKLSKLSRELLDTFDMFAMNWGCMSDQGVGSKVDRSALNYKESKENLAKRISYLEKLVKSERKKHKKF
jgi:hypothetical protein